MKKLFLYLGAAAIAAAALVSCNKEFSSASLPMRNESEISIRPAGTKSAVSGTGFVQGYDMKVSAFRNLGSMPGEDVAANYFEGIRFGYDGVAGAWKSENGVKYYPMDGTLDFLALASAGYNADTTGIAPSLVWGDASGNVAKKVVATVPDNSAKFDDLLFGSANACGLSASGTDISFKHAMTSVVFLAKSNVAYSSATNAGITIDSITVDGAKYSGTLTVTNPSAAGGEGDLAAAWSSLGNQKNHIKARVWNAGNTGVLVNEAALTGLNLGTSSKELASYPFGEAYVILPPQAAVPFTITYTIHNGFASDGETPLSKQVQTQITPSGNWDMGKKNVYEIEFDLTEILINPSIVDWAVVENELIHVPEASEEPEEPEASAFTFAGLQIAQGNLYYDGSEFSIDEAWNSHCTYETAYGVTASTASSHFNFLDMGALFEKAGFTFSDGSIENLLDPLSGWRLPTSSEWEAILTDDAAVREGSTVNGTANAHWAHISLTGVTYAGDETPNGILVFPDGATITGKELDGVDSIYDEGEDCDIVTTGVTVAELEAYLEQGCVFLPAAGFYYSDENEWDYGGDEGNYWSSTEKDGDSAYDAYFYGGVINPASYDLKSYYYCSVRLVKSAE